MYDCSVQHAPLTRKFTGKERYSESGLDNFGARFDSSSFGRFMSPDWSAGPVTVPYGTFNNPQTLNLYAYAKNNPLRFRDLDGHCDKDGKHCFWQKWGNWWNGKGWKTDLELAPQGTVTTVTVESHPRLTAADQRRAVQAGLNATMALMTMFASEAANMGGDEEEGVAGDSESLVPATEGGWDTLRSRRGF
jgi:RHS repeat-associated protein